MDFDGSNLTRLTNFFSHARHPVWSPDGHQIAFDVQDTSVFDEGIDTREIFFIHNNGSELQKLTNFNSGVAFDPAWSPDGSQLAFSYSNIDQKGIFIIDRDGQNLVRVTMELGSYVCWSPDGTQLAYTAERNNSFGLYLNNLEGTNERLLIDSLADCRTWFIEPQASALPFTSWGQIKSKKD